MRVPTDRAATGDPDRLRVALLAAAGPLRDHLAAALADSPAVASCRTEPDLAGGEAFTTAVVRPPGRRRRLDPDLDAAERIFDDLSTAAVRHWVVLSSSMVHAPSHRHPGMVNEAHASPPGHRVADAWAELERLAGERLPPAARLTVLRPAPVPVPEGDDLFSRLLHRRWAFVPAGFDPPLQLLDAADLGRALRAAVERAPRGVFHVVPAAAPSLRTVLRRAGVRPLPVPGPLLRLVHRADEIDYLRHPWTASGGELERRLDVGPGPRRAAPDEFEACDGFGMDRAYIAAKGRTLLGFLHDAYWRIEHRGLEHVPRRGRAVLAGVHRGFQPWDGVMTLHLIASRLGRVPRFLVHPTLVKFPFLAPFMTRLGGLLACRENADRVLQRDGLLGVYPEGIRGAFARYRDAYRLRRFGRHDFVRMALANRAPIVPFVTVGSAEIYPILAKVRWRWWQRVSEWPCFPITPTMGLVPLPSKWHVRFLEPLRVEEQHPPEAARDPAVVRAISGEVRRRMEAAIADLLRRRKHVFWGSAFAPEPASGTFGEEAA